VLREGAGSAVNVGHPAGEASHPAQERVTGAHRAHESTELLALAAVQHWGHGGVEREVVAGHGRRLRRVSATAEEAQERELMDVAHVVIGQSKPSGHRHRSDAPVARA
jgi:hypothetical protein